MRKLGLIGGMGPESTVVYYQRICQEVCKRAGGSFFPNLTIESRDCFVVTVLCEEGRYDELVDYYVEAVETLARAGCDFAAIGCNTGHIVFDRVAERSPIPLVSIVEAKRDVMVEQGFKRPLLLGTKATMEGTFFKNALIAAGMGVVRPPEPEREWLYRTIFDELEMGVVTDESVARFGRLVADGAEHGADCVILGCTELPMLADRLELPIPAVDTLQIHIDALVDAIMEE